MRLQRIRSAAAAALATVLALGAPAHAAGWETWTATPAWLESALQWMASLWVEDDTAAEKADAGDDLTSSAPQPAPPTTGSDLGPGIDPNG